MAWDAARTRRSVAVLTGFGRAHRGVLLAGLLATIGVVAIRVLMPWPLRWIFEAATEMGQPGWVVDRLPGWPANVLYLTGAYILLSVVVGFAELRQRVFMKRFTARTVADLRRAVMKNAPDVSEESAKRQGDRLARMVGDAARLRAELAGVLIHVSQSMLLFLGICLLFLFLAPKLSVFFFAGGGFAVLVGYLGMPAVADIASRLRAKEGRFASAMVMGEERRQQQRLNRSAARKDVRATRRVMTSAWLLHICLSMLMGAGLIVGVNDVRAGALAPGDLFLFIAYVLTVHRRMVMVGRQLARGGKALAHAERLGELLHPGHGAQELRPLRSELRIEGLRVGSSVAGGPRRRLKRSDLTIAAGEKLLIVGAAEKGRSSFLSALSGHEQSKGDVLWDGDATSARMRRQSKYIRYLPHAPMLRPRRLGSLLGVRDEEEMALRAELARGLGLDEFLQEQPHGLDTVVRPQRCTRRQIRALLLFELLADRDSSVWLLDEPCEGLKTERANELLRLILRNAGERIVIVGQSHAAPELPFDRVVEVSGRRIAEPSAPVSAGTAAEEKSWERGR